MQLPKIEKLIEGVSLPYRSKIRLAQHLISMDDILVRLLNKFRAKNIREMQIELEKLLEKNKKKCFTVKP